jgi:hypothetical protein
MAPVHKSRISHKRFLLENVGCFEKQRPKAGTLKNGRLLRGGESSVGRGIRNSPNVSRYLRRPDAPKRFFATVQRRLSADFVEKVRGCRGAVVLIQSGAGIGVLPMMGEGRSGQDALFYEFSLERHVPAEHLLRSIDRFVDLDGVRCELAPFYSEIGRPSIGFKPNVTLLV